jgi:hypothetical protein
MYTVVVTRAAPPVANGGVVIITPNMLTMTLSGYSTVLSRTGSWSLLATPSHSVDAWMWYLDGNLLTGASTSTTTLNGSELVVGPHSIMVVGKKSGILFSTSYYFTVE